MPSGFLSRYPSGALSDGLKPAENAQTSLTFRHTNWPASVTADDLGSINLTWALVVDRLKQYTETGKPVPYFAFATR